MSPSIESLRLPSQADGSTTLRDAAEVIYSPLRGPVTRRSLSMKKMRFLADAKLRNTEAENVQAIPSTSAPSKPTLWRFSLTRVAAFFRGKKKLQHILYCMFTMLVLIVVAFRVLCVSWLASKHNQELPDSRPGNYLNWSVADMYKSVLMASSLFFSSSYELGTFETERVISSEGSEHWAKPNSEGLHQCIDHPRFHKRPKAIPNGYIMANANGGLNQMRDGICDMVAIARIMNAALVIPSLDHGSFWADPSILSRSWKKMCMLSKSCPP